MKPIIKKIIGWVVYLAILAVLIYGIPKALVFALKTQYPMASITSGSMWPSLKKGDLVFIKGISGKQDIQINDIVVYRNNQGFTIHRVIGLDETTLTTKGDANNTPDNPVSYSEVIGKTVSFGEKPFRVPMLGMVSILFNNKL